jgi:hypothetical protein
MFITAVAPLQRILYSPYNLSLDLWGLRKDELNHKFGGVFFVHLLSNPKVMNYIILHTIDAARTVEVYIFIDKITSFSSDNGIANTRSVIKTVDGVAYHVTEACAQILQAIVAARRV